MLSAMFSLAALISAIVAGCTGSSTPGANRPATPAPGQSPASSPRVFGPPGSAGNPLIRDCAAEVWSYPSVSFHRRPADIVIGPLDIVGGKAVASLTPAGYGYNSFERGGRFYKMAVVVTRGATATVTIAPPARGHVVIALGSLGSVTSATYHSCAHKPNGFFAQGFAFTHRPFRGCVPLDVIIGNRTPVHHVTLSLFAGTCA